MMKIDKDVQGNQKTRKETKVKNEKEYLIAASAVMLDDMDFRSQLRA